MEKDWLSAQKWYYIHNKVKYITNVPVHMSYVHNKSILLKLPRRQLIGMVIYIKSSQKNIPLHVWSKKIHVLYTYHNQKETNECKTCKVFLPVNKQGYVHKKVVGAVLHTSVSVLVCCLCKRNCTVIYIICVCTYLWWRSVQTRGAGYEKVSNLWSLNI